MKLGLGDGAPGASTSGCEAADFAGFARGAVALVRRGTCTFQTKVEHAVAAGAVGVVVMNEGTEGRRDAFSGQLNRPAAIPVVGVPYERGLALNRAAVSDGGATVRLAVDAVTGTRTTHNVLADVPGSSADTVIMVGAHLDSVPEGPGINDNGSGSAAVLEAALTLARDLVAARAPVRFAFWGAEERGLIGSRHHVEALSEAERHRIALYINLDMVGSPNFVRFVQGTAAPGNDSPVNIARRELLAGFRNADLSIEERTGGRFGSDNFVLPKRYPDRRPLHWRQQRKVGGGRKTVRRDRGPAARSLLPSCLRHDREHRPHGVGAEHTGSGADAPGIDDAGAVAGGPTDRLARGP